MAKTSSPGETETFHPLVSPATPLVESLLLTHSTYFAWSSVSSPQLVAMVSIRHVWSALRLSHAFRVCFGASWTFGGGSVFTCWCAQAPAPIANAKARFLVRALAMVFLLFIPIYNIYQKGKLTSS